MVSFSDGGNTMSGPDPPDNSHLLRNTISSESINQDPLLTSRNTNSKRARQPTGHTHRRLQPHPRALGVPQIGPTPAFLFKGSNPLYAREALQDRNKENLMSIRCTRPECTYTKIIERALSGINDFKAHYRNKHARIATSEAEERVPTEAKIHDEGGPQSLFPASKSLMPMMDQHNRQYRRLLLQLIIKNNLSFSVADQTEFDDLVKFIAPTMITVSRHQLMKDLREDFEGAKEVTRKEFQKHMEAGGRFSLTTYG